MEQEKISALVEENMKTIFAYALSRTSHREDAEDLAGDIILAILGSAHRIRDDKAFFGYIWAIAANTYRKYLYKKSRLHYEDLDDETADDADFIQDILHSEQLNTLRRELALLSREYRECTLAYYFEGLSCGETASRLHISLEMVKYYLFKTRKILKEGISMEREFGVKSYQPAKFEFYAVFSGSANMAYQNLFNRKLPGNILLSTYYTPATIRQLAIELGVASVYLEDEISVLEKYDLLTALPGGRYQARLVIFTEEYRDEFYRTAQHSLTAEVGAILLNVSKKLPELRKLHFAGDRLADNCLLWDFLFELTLKGRELFVQGRKNASRDAEPSGQGQQKASGGTGTSRQGQQEASDGTGTSGQGQPKASGGTGTSRQGQQKASGDAAVYRELDGICYGKAYDTPEGDVCHAVSFAGYCPVKGSYAASYADYAILPAKNRYTAHAGDIAAGLDAVLAGKTEAVIPVVSKDQNAAILEILREEISAFAGLYEKLYDCALSILQVHAPESIRQITGSVLAKVLLFQTVGLIGVCAVRSGVLEIPEDGQVLGGFVYCTE